jgi:RNA polymerase sigma factor (sigma-70 family)
MPPAPSLSPLLLRAARGDPAVVQACIARFGGLVWSLARKLPRDTSDVEDAVQEIFIDLWKSVERFDPLLSSEAAFVATIARRRLLDRRRNDKSRPLLAPLPEELESDLDSAEPLPATLAAHVIEDARVHFGWPSPAAPSLVAAPRRLRGAQQPPAAGAPAVQRAPQASSPAPLALAPRPLAGPLHRPARHLRRRASRPRLRRIRARPPEATLLRARLPSKYAAALRLIAARSSRPSIPSRGHFPPARPIRARRCPARPRSTTCSAVA